MCVSVCVLFNVCVWFTCVGVGVLSVDFFVDLYV